MESLQGKKAIITGGARGVGKAVAIALANEGVEVGLIARTKDDLQNVTDEITQAGGKACYAVVDVSDFDKACQAIEKLQTQLRKVDILINNAAIAAFGIQWRWKHLNGNKLSVLICSGVLCNKSIAAAHDR